MHCILYSYCTCNVLYSVYYTVSAVPHCTVLFTKASEYCISLNVQYTPDHQCGKAEGTPSVALRILLLEFGHETRYILDCHSVLHRQLMRLALDARAIEQHSRVSRETCTQIMYSTRV